MKIYRMHSANYEKKGGRSLQRTSGAWITKPFTNWKKVTQKMKSHSKREMHLLSCQLDMKADRARKEGSIYQPASKCWRAVKITKLEGR